MLKDLDKIIRQLLLEGLEIKNDEIGIAFDQPRREWSAKLSKPTVNLFLYDMRENAQLRQHQWEQVMNGKNGTLAAQKRTPLRYDCYYMMTTWVRDQPEDEHRLLTRCMLTLARYPLIPEERLAQTALANPDFEIRTRLANHDVLTNPAEIWGALDNEMRPSISYVITMTLDPWTPITGPAVQTLTLRYGQSDSLPDRQELMTDMPVGELNWIGGVVRAKDEQGPLANINVAIRGTGLFATSDAKGRYRLGNVPTGEHTLIAWPAEGAPITRPIQVPLDKEGNYDIEL